MRTIAPPVLVALKPQHRAGVSPIREQAPTLPDDPSARKSKATHRSSYEYISYHHSEKKPAGTGDGARVARREISGSGAHAARRIGIGDRVSSRARRITGNSGLDSNLSFTGTADRSLPDCASKPTAPMTFHRLFTTNRQASPLRSRSWTRCSGPRSCPATRVRNVTQARVRESRSIAGWRVSVSNPEFSAGSDIGKSLSVRICRPRSAHE